MKCPTCGLENRPEAQFCKQCGQPLESQVAPTAPPAISGTVCPACGATAKPRARFCPRCGKPLPTEPSLSLKETQPSVAPASEPSAEPPAPPPPSTTSVPERRSPGWLKWAAGIVAFLCIVAIAVAGIIFVPRLIAPPAESTATPSPAEAPTQTPTAESPPTEVPPSAIPTMAPPLQPTPAESPVGTPTLEARPEPGFEAQVGVAASRSELRAGERVTVTVTVTNTGQTPFGSLRYQLLGDWQPYANPITEAVVEHELDVEPGQSDAATFVLQATQTGTARIQANVTLKTRGEEEAVKSVTTGMEVEIVVKE